jgi:hypothetical protein
MGAEPQRTPLDESGTPETSQSKSTPDTSPDSAKAQDVLRLYTADAVDIRAAVQACWQWCKSYNLRIKPAPPEAPARLQEIRTLYASIARELIPAEILAEAQTLKKEHDRAVSAAQDAAATRWIAANPPPAIAMSWGDDVGQDTLRAFAFEACRRGLTYELDPEISLHLRAKNVWDYCTRERDDDDEPATLDGLVSLLKKNSITPADDDAAAKAGPAPDARLADRIADAVRKAWERSENGINLEGVYKRVTGRERAIRENVEWLVKVGTLVEERAGRRRSFLPRGEDR